MGLRGTGPVMVVVMRGAVLLILGRLVKAAERDRSLRTAPATA